MKSCLDDPESVKFRQKVGAEYTYGLCWVLRYYYQVWINCDK
jgi:5'-3' exonuclease